MNSNVSLTLNPYNDFLRGTLLSGRGVNYKIANELARLCEEYSIKWVALNINGVPNVMFPGNQLAEAKGLERTAFVDFLDDRVRHTSSKYDVGFNPTSSQTPEITRLSGKGIEFKKVATLKGDALREFKQDYKDIWGESLPGRSNKLLVCGWELAYHFLTQGTTPLAQEFAALGSEAIASDVREVVNNQQPALVSEAELQQMLIVASGYSEIKMVAETAYIQIDPDNPRQFTSRHVDLLEKQPGHVIIYELKRDRITLQHIHETLVERRYLELVAAKYPSTKKFTITLIAPNGIDADAQDRLHQTYREFGNHGQSYRLTYVSFGSLLARLLNNAMKSRPALARWRLQRELKKESLINYLSTGERDALFNELTEDQLIIEHQKLGLTYVPREPALTGGN